MAIGSPATTGPTEQTAATLCRGPILIDRIYELLLP